jgi:DNA mismatch repair protein MutH
MTLAPPCSEQELLQRARQLAGMTLAHVAKQYHGVVPEQLQHAKGWLGQLLEQALGANAGNQAQPDFVDLGVELKTLPLRLDGTPKESTYVCTVSLNTEIGVNWAQSWVCRKLRRVLWLPVEADPRIAIADRRVGTAILWSPSPADATILQQDWEEIMELVSIGRSDELSARLGTYLQVRPKAANSRALTHTTDAEGNAVLTLPRGFYLRARFTHKILREHYV